MDYLILDERGPGVTAGFILRADNPLPSFLGADPSHNSISFFVSFADVRQFRVEGCGSRRTADFTIDVFGEEMLNVHIQGPDTDIEFTCSGAVVACVTTSRAGSF
jgi:hypothetical protein